MYCCIIVVCIVVLSLSVLYYRCLYYCIIVVGIVVLLLSVLLYYRCLYCCIIVVLLLYYRCLYCCIIVVCIVLSLSVLLYYCCLYYYIIVVCIIRYQICFERQKRNKIFRRKRTVFLASRTKGNLQNFWDHPHILSWKSPSRIKYNVTHTTYLEIFVAFQGQLYLQF